MRWQPFLLLMLLLLLPAAAQAAETIPVPSFSGHEIPETQNPAPRATLLEYADLAAVGAGLALASYLALFRRSRRGLLVLTIVSLAWLGFWRKGCICPIGAIQNVSLALFDTTYAVPLSAVALFAAPLIVALFFGRTFCAGVCPLGAVQELVAVRPLRVPQWLDQALGLLAFVYLGAAVLLAATGTAFLICRYDPFVSLFRLSGERNMLILAGCFLLLGLFVGRPYCRYLCPYGALLGLAARAARWQVRIPPEQCIQCRLCEDACPYGAIREPTIAPPASDRRPARLRLALLLLLVPVLLGTGAWLGSGLGPSLARLHPTFRLAQRLRMEETGEVQGTTDASEDFRSRGGSAEDLYREAGRVAQMLGSAGMWFGVWVGLVIGVKLVHLAIRRRRTDYQPDPATCVGCGRCFAYCPNTKAAG